MRYDAAQAVTMGDVVHGLLWVGGSVLLIFVLIALFVILVNILNPFSSGH